MDAQELIAKLFDEKKLKVLRVFFDNPEEDFYIREIAKKTRIPVATTFRIINRLRELDIIRIKRIKKFKVYFLNRTKEVELLQDIVIQKKSALNEFVEKVSEIDGVEQIILHGKEEKDKAGVIVLGNNIPIGKVKSIVVEIKETFDFNIIDLTVNQDQLDKMSDMSLFSGRKTVLFQK